MANYWKKSGLAFFSLFLSITFLTSCSFPVRTGYDRKIGDYKPVPSAQKSSTTTAQNTSSSKDSGSKAETAKVAKVAKAANPATQPAPKVSTAPVKKQAPASSGKKYSSLKEYTDSWKGTKYVYGGSSRKGTDCSGYMMNIYRDFYGVSLDHKASMIYEDSRFTKVSRGDLKEGDLVFFGDFWGISHIGIYLKDDVFSHASTSKGVMESKLSEKYFDSRYKGARRLKR